MVSTEIVLEPVENAFQNLYYHHTHCSESLFLYAQLVDIAVDLEKNRIVV